MGARVVFGGRRLAGEGVQWQRRVLLHCFGVLGLVTLGSDAPRQIETGGPLCQSQKRMSWGFAFEQKRISR